MGDSDLGLLFKIRGDSSGATKATAETRAAIASLRTSFGSDLTQMQTVASGALGQVTQSLASVTSQTPVLGSAVSGLTTQFGSMALGISAATGAALLGVGAMVALGRAIFTLAENAADYGGKIYDAAQKTNFGVETLSALGIAAKNSGASLESLEPSLIIFQKNMEKAAEGQKEMSALFKANSIDTRDNEKALRQAFEAVTQLGSGTQQTALAMQLFGRSGKDVLGVIKETNGDLDEAIKKYDEMGLIVSSKAGAAADRFGDTVSILGSQLQGLANTIGFEVLPVLTVLAEQMSTALLESRSGWSSWAHFVADEIAGVAAEFQALLVVIASRGTLDFFTTFQSFKRGILDQAAQEQAGQENVGGGSFRTHGESATGGTGRAAKSAKDALYTAQLEASAETAKKEIETQRHLAESLKLTYEEQRATLEEFYKGEQDLADAHFNTLIDQINREQEAVDAARARKSIKAEEADKKDAELDQRTLEAKNKLHEAERRLALDQQKAQDKAELDLNKQLLDTRNAMRGGELQRIEAQLKLQQITESEAIVRRQAVYQQEHQDRMLLFDLELNQLSTSAARKIAIDNEKIASEERYTNAVTKLTQDRIKAQFDEQNAAAEGKTRKRRTTDPDSLDVDAPTGAIDQLFKAINDNLTGNTQTAAMAGLQAMTEVFSQLGQAIGQAARAWVLYGNAGTSVRKVTAEVLASITQMAIVKAAFEVAEGFAALALAFFGIPNAGPSANAHFAAAAIYAGIAGIAAIAGRQVAGNSFASPAGASSSGSSGGGSSGSSSPATTQRDRLNYQPVEIRLVLAGGLHEVVEAHVVKNWNSNGRIRTVIQNDGQS